jgi:hypothetical protein
MRLLIEIDGNRVQSALLEAEQDSTCEFVTRSVDDGVAVYAHGQQWYRWRSRLTVTPVQVAPVDGRGDHHVQPLAGKAAARCVVRHLLRPFAVDFGVGGLSQPQLDAGPDLIPQRRSDLRPAGRRQHDMHAE